MSFLSRLCAHLGDDIKKEVCKEIHEESWHFNDWPVRVIRRSRRRSVTIELKAHEPIVVRVNKSIARDEIELFLVKKRKWIEKTLAKLAVLPKHEPVRLQAGEQIFFMGESLSVQRTVTTLRRPFLAARDGGLFLHLPMTAAGPSSPDLESARQCLQQFYVREARRFLPAQLEAISSLMGLKPSRISIRYLRSRWGSCSSQGRITLNARLMGAPCWVIDAVIVHELAHLQHLNHSPDFWRLVEHFAPRHEEADRWLEMKLPPG